MIRVMNKQKKIALTMLSSTANGRVGLCPTLSNTLQIESLGFHVQEVLVGRGVRRLPIAMKTAVIGACCNNTDLQ